MSDPVLSAAWADADVSAYVQTMHDLGADPLDMAGCWLNESALNPRAMNAGSKAAGLWQAMPATLKGLGYGKGPDAFTHEPIQIQVAYARAYYWPHRGRLVSSGACYLATFLPAYMSHAADNLFVLASSTLHPEWYRPNAPSFDPGHRGYFTVGDLTACVERRKLEHARLWAEFAERVRQAMQEAPTQPEPLAVLFVPDTLPADDAVEPEPDPAA